ncbi:MAG: hypothetical protein LAT80_15090 [Balneolaceae bacterium]|nr:hypothetical protein [Balneolaceae bacterium]
MKSLIADILLLGSLGVFITGILSLFIRQIRINEKSRYYFLITILLFIVGLAFGWSDFIAGFQEGRC